MAMDLTSRVLRQLRPVPAPQVPIATGMFLPNHSGDHSKGIVRSDPAGDMSIVNRSYLEGNYLGLAGGTLTGPLTISSTLSVSDTITVADELTLSHDGTDALFHNGVSKFKFQTSGVQAQINLISNDYSNDTNKQARIEGAHYHGVATPTYLIMLGVSTSSSTRVYIGGGSTVSNCATQVSFFAAASVTTLTGTEMLNITTAGIKFAAAVSWTANGTNTVTISNVAPAGVGTATIGKWLTVKDNAGTTYYIPAWT